MKICYCCSENLNYTEQNISIFADMTLVENYYICESCRAQIKHFMYEMKMKNKQEKRG
jgi:ABC-type branched-subunit amino acid transport system ATPase component